MHERDTYRLEDLDIIGATPDGKADSRSASGNRDREIVLDFKEDVVTHPTLLTTAETLRKRTYSGDGNLQQMKDSNREGNTASQYVVSKS